MPRLSRALAMGQQLFLHRFIDVHVDQPKLVAHYLYVILNALTMPAMQVLRSPLQHVLDATRQWSWTPSPLAAVPWMMPYRPRAASCLTTGWSLAALGTVREETAHLQHVVLCATGGRCCYGVVCKSAPLGLKSHYNGVPW